ncbi:MAG: hypothetical protein ACR2JF_05010 [Iamia sp.]
MRASEIEEARSFVEAVAWGEHRRVWALLSAEGRRLVLDVAGRRGMDAALVGQLRAGTADEPAWASFLVDLVNGLRMDLRGTDLDHVAYEAAAAPPGGRTAPDGVHAHTWVTIVEPPGASLAALGGIALPVATVELSDEEGTWRVTRLVPQRRP